jgi:hypothetical protein
MKRPLEDVSSGGLWIGTGCLYPEVSVSALRPSGMTHGRSCDLVTGAYVTGRILPRRFLRSIVGTYSLRSTGFSA